MNRFSLLFSVLVLCGLAEVLPLTAGDWDPEDDTFDPTVESVVAEGSTRIGDPSPFFQDGFEDIQGYTTVTVTTGDHPSVNMGFIVPLRPGETIPTGGGIYYGTLENIRALIEGIRSAVTKAGEGEVKKVQEIAKVKGGGDPDSVTVTLAPGADGKPKVELYVHQYATDAIFRLSPNAAKKLSGALEYHLGQLEKAE